MRRGRRGGSGRGSGSRSSGRGGLGVQGCHRGSRGRRVAPVQILGEIHLRMHPRHELVASGIGGHHVGGVGLADRARGRLDVHTRGGRGRNHDGISRDSILQHHRTVEAAAHHCLQELGRLRERAALLGLAVSLGGDNFGFLPFLAVEVGDHGADNVRQERVEQLVDRRFQGRSSAGQREVARVRLPNPSPQVLRVVRVFQLPADGPHGHLQKRAEDGARVRDAQVAVTLLLAQQGVVRHLGSVSIPQRFCARHIEERADRVEDVLDLRQVQ
mmetsp:Transcript_10649/g.26051  ORF Transcript_10649/g.26051 Transcript_10649/m.26051 type:complete len:272 (+) Transcript_10649:772-1587(+)